MGSSVIVPLPGTACHGQNCTLEQARKLIRNRVDAFFGDTSEETYLWLMDRLKGVLRTDLSPRTVIDLANRAISQAVPTPKQAAETGNDAASGARQEVRQVLDALKLAYHEEREKVMAERDMWRPDRERLILALETWLESKGTFEVERAKDDKYVALLGRCEREGVRQACRFIVSVDKNVRAVGAALDRGLRFLEANPGGFCCFVADLEGMSSLERWPTARQKLSEFRARKGRAILLDEGRRAGWYGLAALRNKLYNGDVSLSLISGVRLAEKADFVRFMREGFPEDLLKDEPDDGEGDLRSLQGRPMSSVDESRLGEAILNTLNGSPMKIMKADLLLELLNRGGVAVSYAGLLAFVNREKGRFTLYPAGDGSLVQVA